VEIKQVQTFVAVAETLHFGHAAEQLRIAQPHVSRRIKQLEEELDVLLFYRDKRNVRLTEAGVVFLAEAKKLLNNADAAAERAKESARGRRGNLHISLLNSSMLEALSRVLGDFHRRYPNVYLSFSEASSFSLFDDLRQGVTDLAFFHSPARALLEYERITIEREPLVAVLPRSHRLANRPKLKLVDLANEPWVMFPRGPGSYVFDLIISLCQRSGFSPNIVQEAATVQSRLGLVAAGFGVHLVHRSWQTIAYPGVVYVPIEPTAMVSLTCYWRRNNTNPIINTFVDVVRKYELPPERGGVPAASLSEPVLSAAE
jgi:DNA-binding transcriptional LysR family regulator